MQKKTIIKLNVAWLDDACTVILSFSIRVVNYIHFQFIQELDDL